MTQRSQRVFPDKPAEEANAFFAADMVRQRDEQVIGQHRAVSAKNDLRAGRMLADQLDHALHLVERRHDEIDADVVIAPASKFVQKLALRRIVKHDRRGRNVLGDVIEPPAADYLAKTEDALGAGYLGMEKLRPDGIALTESAEGPAYGC